MTSRGLLVALVLCSACCRGRIGIFIRQGEGVDVSSFTHVVVTAYGPAGEWDKEFQPNPGGFKDGDALEYRDAYAKEGDWLVTISGYVKNQLVALGRSTVRIEGPCYFLSSGYSDIDVTTEVWLTSDAVH
jgi:hypothetical protein